MKNKKTLEHLNSKAWYRLIKVFYISTYAVFFLGSIIVSVAVNKPYYSIYSRTTIGGWDEAIGIAILSVVVTVLVFEFIRRAFYYVVFGTIKPQKLEIVSSNKISMGESKNIYCIKCGASNVGTSNFCEKCGCKIVK